MPCYPTFECSARVALVLGVCLRASHAAAVPTPAAVQDAFAGGAARQAFEAKGCKAAACLIPNPCEGTKPKPGAGFDNKACMVEGLVKAVEQSGANVTKGYQGLLNTTAVPITTSYAEAGLCPVNVHWHLGAEHLSVGEFDEHGSGPSKSGPHRRADGSVRKGFQCQHYNKDEPKYTKAFDWKHCENMEVGQTYEVHWPHSKGGDCGTIHQYQTPFYDGVFCHGGKLAPTTQAAIGVQSQTFVIVNDEAYYQDNLFKGMVVDDKGHGTDMAMYTGSTTGTSRSNEVCSAYGPITWQVDRKCHLVSASSFDKMCKDMKAQNDDMSGDVHPHGSRELVADVLAANNFVHGDGHGDHGHRDRRAADAADAESCACLEERLCDAASAGGSGWMAAVQGKAAAATAAAAAKVAAAKVAANANATNADAAANDDDDDDDTVHEGWRAVGIVFIVFFALALFYIFNLSMQRGVPVPVNKTSDNTYTAPQENQAAPLAVVQVSDTAALTSVTAI